jgi:hypothetical protein
MQGMLDAVTAAGALLLGVCAHGLGGFCGLVWVVIAFHFPLGVLLLVGVISGALLAAELSSFHPNHRAATSRATEPPRRA